MMEALASHDMTDKLNDAFEWMLTGRANYSIAPTFTQRVNNACQQRHRETLALSTGKGGSYRVLGQALRNNQRQRSSFAHILNLSRFASSIKPEPPFADERMPYILHSSCTMSWSRSTKPEASRVDRSFEYGYPCRNR
ncbi:hypothetical protein M378DRAFT_418684 [Amanita muscaria Koide BX008]|uniref:Uncharacterized protein n=1 Tax=Amanita muscaria (strain Koide BX008) TaxID=946122 RepID=A0A0C2WKC4_AMAMK|nr:hypothetical protein M378DRAFT_418684 [Amanita muscaria Koide BX008]